MTLTHCCRQRSRCPFIATLAKVAAEAAECASGGDQAAARLSRHAIAILREIKGVRP